jgi:hypothetical protein
VVVGFVVVVVARVVVVVGCVVVVVVVGCVVVVVVVGCVVVVVARVVVVVVVVVAAATLTSPKLTVLVGVQVPPWFGILPVASSMVTAKTVSPALKETVPGVDPAVKSVSPSTPGIELLRSATGSVTGSVAPLMLCTVAV